MKNLILAIESSCDDSSIAIINKNTFECIYHKKISQEKEHYKYGGVVPELAARLHSEALPRILSECKKYFSKLCAIAVTSNPGLSVSLVGGITMAKVLSLSLGLPLLSINHLKGHIYSLFLEEEFQNDIGILLVSGGHTMVLKIDSEDCIHMLAFTNDDSFGESFDKVAKMMDLGYPGGEIIEKLAKKAILKNIKFTIPLLHSKELNYSFSGLKNAVRLEILKYKNLNEQVKSEIAFGFEEAAIAHILDKLKKIFKSHSFKKFGIVGGASANLKLRGKIKDLCDEYSCELKLAPLKYCSDNALMIARAACAAFEKKQFSDIHKEILSAKSVNFDTI